MPTSSFMMGAVQPLRGCLEWAEALRAEVQADSVEFRAYICKQCDNTWEDDVPADEILYLLCPLCHSARVEITQVQLVFSGTELAQAAYAKLYDYKRYQAECAVAEAVAQQPEQNKPVGAGFQLVGLRYGGWKWHFRDWWVGVYLSSAIERKRVPGEWHCEKARWRRTVYVCPLPCLPIKFHLYFNR